MCAAPAILARRRASTARRRPRRVPGRHVDAVGDVADRHLGAPASAGRAAGRGGGSPSPCSRLTPLTATAAAHGEVGHVEGLGGIGRPLAAERQQLVDGDAERLARVRRPGSARSRSASKRSKPAATGVCVVNRLPARVTASATSNGWPVSSMKPRARSSTAKAACPSLRWQTSGRRPSAPQQAPAADAEDDLLRQAQLRSAAVELAGDAAVGRRVGGIVAVEQVERHAPDLHLPGAQPDRAARAAPPPGGATRRRRRAPA